MPNPVPATIKIAGPLTDRQFALLGRVLNGWSNVELRLAYTVAVLSTAKVRSILFAFQNMTIRAKLETAGAVVRTEADPLFPGMSDEFLPLLEDARRLSAVRNAAAHSCWLGLSVRGHMIAVDIEARRQRSQIGRVAWQEREFISAIGSLDDLAARMKRVTDDIRHEGYVAPDLGYGYGQADFS